MSPKRVVNNIWDDDKFADKYRIPSSRLNGWDYSSPGLYFVTICTYCHNKFLGEIVDEKMVLSSAGEIVRDCLLQIPLHFNHARIDSSVVMPNHVHLIVNIEKRLIQPFRRDVACYVSTNKNIPMSKISPKSNSLSSIIRSFKSSFTRQCGRRHIFFSWQPRFYDRIIRSEKQLFAIRQYIADNPASWSRDPYYPLSEL